MLCGFVVIAACLSVVVARCEAAKSDLVGGGWNARLGKEKARYLLNSGLFFTDLVPER